MLTVSLVIPVRNAAQTLDACLTSLAQLEPRPIEIVLVDNGSTDESLQRLRAFARETTSPPVTVVTETRPGAAAARNAGIRASHGDVIAFTDSDCAVDRAWLSYLVKPFADDRVGAVAGRIVAAPPRNTCGLFCGLYTLQSPPAGRIHDRWTPTEGGFPTANLAVRRTILEQVGGFDEGIRIYGEDYDLCARIYRRGRAIAYTPEAIVRHHHRTTLRALTRQSFGFGRGQAYLLRRHGPRALWITVPGRQGPLRVPLLRAWIDLASADKKVMALVLCSLLYRPAWLLLPLYALWLMAAATRRARAGGSPLTPATSAGLAGLLVWKSFALTLGRWWGSLKYGAVCL